MLLAPSKKQQTEIGKKNHKSFKRRFGQFFHLRAEFIWQKLTLLRSQLDTSKRAIYSMHILFICCSKNMSPRLFLRYLRESQHEKLLVCLKRDFDVSNWKNQCSTAVRSYINPWSKLYHKFSLKLHRRNEQREVIVPKRAQKRLFIFPRNFISSGKIWTVAPIYWPSIVDSTFIFLWCFAENGRYRFFQHWLQNILLCSK